MEKFLSLSTEKQNKLIDAALICFGTNGYKKASVSDIATTAGVSKALIFHYFGTKKDLYLYIIELCGTILKDEINEKLDNSVTDFFDKIKLLTTIKISVIKKHPAMLSFLNSVYFENDDEVKENIKTILAKGQGENLGSRMAFEGTDTSKFKDDIDPNLIIIILTRLTEGYLSKMPNETEINFDALSEEFDECINLFRKNFYKEKYL